MIWPWTKNMTWVWRLRIASWLLGKPVKLQPGQRITDYYLTPWLCYPAIKNPQVLMGRGVGSRWEPGPDGKPVKVQEGRLRVNQYGPAPANQQAMKKGRIL